MRSEWPRKHLAEISEVITGFPFKGEKYLPPKHGVRVVRGDNVTERYLRWGEKEKCWSGVTADLKPYVLRSGDVVIGMDGSKVGKNFAAISPDDEGSLLAQRVARLRAREGISQDYLRYVICNDSFTEYVKAVHTGTSIPHISKGQIENFEVVVPPFEDQQQIAAVLISLDDRITLLRETNATLEAIAQALFKSWFVDFDPVRAKMEGRTPEGMDEATAALFPDGFETSELGEVPRGWRSATMEDVSVVGIGKTPPRKEQHWFSEDSSDVRWVSIRDMGICGTYASTTSEFLTVEAVDKFNVRRVPDNTVLMSFKMTIGRVAITDGEMTTNEAIAHFRLDPDSPLSTEFIYLHLRHFDFSKLSSTSSIADAVNSKTVRQIPILVPSREVATAFQEKIGVVFEMLKSNEQQAQTLATLRDTLLPRLISGQLRLPEAQAATEAAIGDAPQA